MEVNLQVLKYQGRKEKAMETKKKKKKKLAIFKTWREKGIVKTWENIL